MQINACNSSNSQNFSAQWGNWLAPKFKNLENAVYRSQDLNEIFLFNDKKNTIAKNLKNAVINCRTEILNSEPQDIYYLSLGKNKTIDITTVPQQGKTLTMKILSKIAQKIAKIAKD